MRLATLVAPCVVACACALALTSAAPAAAGSGQVRLGAPPRLPAGSRIVASVASATPIHVTVTLRPRDAAGLQALANAVSTPGSPRYRQYITPQEFVQRFAPSAAQMKAVETSLRAHGLRAGTPSPNHLSIPVSTTAGAAARAFSVSFAHVVLRSGASGIVNQQAPAVDAAVAPVVQTVLGLDTVSKAVPLLVRNHTARAAPRERAHVATGGPQACAAATSADSQGGYTDDQIASAYGLSGLYTSGGPGGAPDFGAGQTVAILELEPYTLPDIQTYAQCYTVNGQPINPQVANVNVDGGASGTQSGEAALDIENVIGLAPQANVIVYEGPNSGSGPYDTFSSIISQHLAQVVTASWGQCEPLNGFSQAQAESILFQQAAAEGMTIVSAAGDDGSEDCFPESSSAAVDDPASQPYVTGVGGTSLASIGPRPSESVWNDGVTVGAGGGGVSSFWTTPTYQSAAPSSLRVINSGSSGSACGASSGDCREVPDVSADADPATGYTIYWNGGGSSDPTQQEGWQVVGGTSGAAPLWAALIALTNASAGCQGVTVGFANPALYYAAGTAYGSDFNDITSGNNDMTGNTGGRFAATPGYDMATGLGSPDGSALAGSLCTDAIALGNPGAQRRVVSTPVGLQILSSDTRGHSVAYSAVSLPSGLSINSSSGKITGRPRRLGTSVLTVIASDAFGATARTSFSWTIQSNPSLSRVSLAGVGATRPKLSFTVAAGRDAPKLQTLTVTLPSGLSFSRSPAGVAVSGLKVKHLRFTASLQRGTLVLKLETAAQQVRVTISYPRLTSGGSLAAQVARHSGARVTITVHVTDAARLNTKLTSKIKPRS
ncbi:MAG: protease pro-enzyme activation domain-containing protein [Solirubrobacteraceae bacterium]